MWLFAEGTYWQIKIYQVMLNNKPRHLTGHRHWQEEDRKNCFPMKLCSAETVCFHLLQLNMCSIKCSGSTEQTQYRPLLVMILFSKSNYQRVYSVSCVVKLYDPPDVHFSGTTINSLVGSSYTGLWMGVNEPSVVKVISWFWVSGK